MGRDSNLTPNPEGDSIGLTSLAKAALIAEEAAPENVIPIRPVPSDNPNDSQCPDACARLTDSSQDTKPAESARTACRQDQAGALSDNTSTPRPQHPLATIGTQTDETNQSLAETLLEKETPPPLVPCTQRRGRGRTDQETPDGPEPEAENNLWPVLPVAKATWRPTYLVRAVTSADDVDPRVQEVLDLAVLNLVAAQEEDPDLVFVKELLRDHGIRPPWNAV